MECEIQKITHTHTRVDQKCIFLNWEAGGRHAGPGLGSRVGARIPRIHNLSKPPVQPVPCEQVHCHEVWLKHVTYAVNMCASVCVCAYLLI